jgi:hypothetical protein
MDDDCTSKIANIRHFDEPVKSGSFQRRKLFDRPQLLRRQSVELIPVHALYSIHQFIIHETPRHP